MEEIVIFDYIENSNKKVEEVFLCFNFSMYWNEVQNRFINMRINGQLIPIIKSKFLDYHKILPKLYPIYKENGEEFKINYETEYWEEYSEGFKKGYSDFSQSLKADLSFNNDTKYIEQILRHTIIEPIKGSFHTLNIDGFQKKIMKLETFYNCGIISGQVYRAWVFIVKANSLYRELLKKLFRDEISVFKYAHTHNDLSLKKLLNQSGKDKFSDIIEIQQVINSNSLKKQITKVNNIKDLFREQYQEGFIEFFEVLKNENLVEHPRKISPFLIEPYRLNNYPVNSINVLLDVFVDLKIFKSISNYGKGMNKSDALKVLRSYFGYDTEYKKGTESRTKREFYSDLHRIIKKIKGKF